MSENPVAMTPLEAKTLVLSRAVRLVLPALATALLLAAACTRPTPLPTPEPTALPTFTPRPTFAPARSPTPTPLATATPTSLPTSTPTPTPTPTAGPTSTPGPPAPIGRLQIPKIGVDAAILPVPIVNGDWETKRIVMEVGWLAGTAQLGSDGNIGIAGHVSLKCCGDGPFRWLEKVAPSDEVVIRSAAGARSYRVAEVRVVEPTEIGVLEATDKAQLTLITCYEWDYLQSHFTKRFVVIAR